MRFGRRDSTKSLFLLTLVISTCGLALFLHLHPLSSFFPSLVDMSEFGNHQSPVDIRNSEALYDSSLGDGNFEINYNPSDCVHLINVGNSWQLTCQDQRSSSSLSASHLPGMYRVVQAHAHWGSNPWNGSEHLVLGTGYAAEVHIVHYNTRYGSFPEATKHKDGVAVLGIFVNESPQENPDFDVLVKSLQALKHKGESMKLDGGFDLSVFLPEKKDSFWTYEGSLTTPPFTECVMWTVFKEPISMSFPQLKTFRRITSNNVRRPQKVGKHRKIRASFQLGGKVVEPV